MEKGKAFISTVAQRVWNENKDEPGKAVVIFPNRRAGLFFRKELAKLIDKPVVMPQVQSLEDFLSGFTHLDKIESLEAIFELYEVYKSLQKNKESFDKFFFWGEMILRDFEEIDQYLVNPDHLFTSIKSQKELDEAFYFLDENEKRIIQSFWSSFLPDSTQSQKLFLETWRIFLPLYQGFTERLLSQGQAYGGLIYRKLAENLKDLTVAPGNYYFCGFNALTGSEEKIIKHFILEHKAVMIWDVDAYYMNDLQQEAGNFFRQYRKDTLLGKDFPKVPAAAIGKEKKITATGVSLEVGQTKILGQQLAAAAVEPDFDPSKTVVVLPHEHMLFPVLHSIPDTIDKINITMGYPMKDSAVYSLLESLLELQKNRKESLTHGTYFYFKPVLQVLQHPLILPLAEDKILKVVASIRKRNLISIYPADLTIENHLIQLILEKNEDPIAYLMGILKELYTYWKEREREIELEFVAGFYEQLRVLLTMISGKKEPLGYEFFLSLFRNLARSYKIPFTGEPLDGLQIMGILETRNLDFDRVYILNMNEGSWPASPRRGSFVPYNIRRAFGLPVFENNDAIYAYLFYRLLQHSKEVHFYYNTVSEFNVNGEISRLVRQLEVESGLKIDKQILSNPIKTKPVQPICIEKSDDVLAVMKRFTSGYEKADRSKLTASALNTYLDCRLKFYFKYVAKLYEPDDVQEEMDPMVFGNLLHNTMEILYESFVQKQKRDVVSPQDIFWLREGVGGSLKKAFMKHYHIKDNARFKLEGRAVIASEVLKKFVSKILDLDQEYAPFQIVGLEAGSESGYIMEVPIGVGNVQQQIRIHGIIDRIDRKGDKVRVLDYKTGKDEKSFTTIASLIDRADSQRNKTVFQVLFYCYLYFRKTKGKEHIIEPGVFNSRDLFTESFDHRVIYKSGKVPLADFRSVADQFEEVLIELIEEIYNPEVPFDQTEDEKKCDYCPYKNICSR